MFRYQDREVPKATKKVDTMAKDASTTSFIQPLDNRMEDKIILYILQKRPKAPTW